MKFFIKFSLLTIWDSAVVFQQFPAARVQKGDVIEAVLGTFRHTNFDGPPKAFSWFIDDFENAKPLRKRYCRACRWWVMGYRRPCFYHNPFVADHYTE